MTVQSCHIDDCQGGYSYPWKFVATKSTNLKWNGKTYDEMMNLRSDPIY